MTVSAPMGSVTRRGLVFWVLAGAASLMAGWLVPAPAYVRLVLTAAALGLLAVLTVRTPRLVLGLLIGWLAVLGLLRRLVTTVGSAGSLGDPLLLVAPAVWMLLAAVAVSRGALRARTALSTTVLVLTGLLTASVVNPLQGGLTVGLGGWLLVVPPMLAFWVGRSLVDDVTLRRVLALVAALALPAAAYGLYQTFAGFPPWDASWIAEDGYTALNVGGTIRAFGNFASAAEYATFLAIGLVAWLAFWRGLPRLAVTVAALALLGAALWFESARGIIVLTALAVGLMVIARRGAPLPVAVISGIAVLVALPWLVARGAPTSTSGTPTGALVAHQVQGLTDPFGAGSTLPGHIDMAVSGVMEAVTNPIGRGVGAVTTAASKYGSSGGSTEVDPGNAGIAAGIAGLLAYVVIVVRGLPLAYRTATRHRDALALAALGILTVTFLQWLNGGQYAVAPLPWLMLGWLDRGQDQRTTTREEGPQ